MKDVSRMDITERLREWSTYDDPPGVTLDDLLNEAADEIDRLSRIAMEQSVTLQQVLSESRGCEHDWKIWPETDGKSQRCMKCGNFRDTPPFALTSRQHEG